MSTELGITFETFGPGPDGGIDARGLEEARIHVLQCKHYRDSSWAALRSSARAEARRAAGSPIFDSYTFGTTQRLNVARVDELVAILRPLSRQQPRVLGIDQIDGLLNKHSLVETRHPKLWLGSGAALRALVQSGANARNRSLVADIQSALPKYVKGSSFDEGVRLLASDTRTVLVSGAPGAGKTTLAHMLVAQAIQGGAQAIEVGADISEAWDALDQTSAQIFLYDDFLGETLISQLHKNELARLVKFIRHLRATTRSSIVLTTREYILQDALAQSDAFRRESLELSRLVLELREFSRFDRAQMLLNHIWHSEIAQRSWLEELAEHRGYRSIIDHPNFTPRLIAHVTEDSAGRYDKTESWLRYAKRTLDRPARLWNVPFEHHLGDPEQGLLLVLASFERSVSVSDLKRSVEEHWRLRGIPLRVRQFEKALGSVADSFVRVLCPDASLKDPHIVRLLNPGLKDYLQDLLRTDAALLRALASGAQSFEQLSVVWGLAEDSDEVDSTSFFRESASVDAAERLLWEPTCEWAFPQTSTGLRKPAFRLDPVFEDRVGLLMRLQENYEPSDRMRELVGRAQQSLVTRWEGGDINPWEAEALPVPSGDSELRARWLTVMKRVLIDSMNSMADLGSLIDFADSYPDAFSDGERDELRVEGTNFANEALRVLKDDFRSESEIDVIEAAVSRLDGEIDQYALGVARTNLADFDESQKDARRNPPSVSRASVWKNGDDRLDALFAVRS